MTITQPSVSPAECTRLAGYSCSLMDIITGAEKIRMMTQCTRCGWVDPASLDRWADDAIKQSMTIRAQNIAVAAGTVPFTFVQRPDEPLELVEIVFQSLGAASMCWADIQAAGEFQSERASVIGQALMYEINSAIKAAKAEAVKEFTRQRMTAVNPITPIY